MQRLRLSDVEGRVYSAATDLEARGEPSYSSAIAREAGMSEEQVRQILHSLAEKNLLRREDSPVDGMDLG
ncbi:MAG: hypothetical protein IRY92_00490, partial [Dactylosporangium sp.]|nr:hypothetical protein [Dactylosporangium sp.]